MRKAAIIQWCWGMDNFINASERDTFWNLIYWCNTNLPAILYLAPTLSLTPLLVLSHILASIPLPLFFILISMRNKMI